MTLTIALMVTFGWQDVSKGADGFEPLFNGKDLSGWTGAKENYDVVDGAIVCKPKKGGVLFTEKDFDDFILRFEFKLPPAGNNGIALRYPGKGRASGDGMGEIQLLDDDHPKYAKLDTRQYTGSLYGIAAAKRGALKKIGEWNQMQIEAVGPNLKITLNGKLILDADVSKIDKFYNDYPHPGKDRKSGRIGLCGHNDPVAVRRIEVKRLAKSGP
jgi:hypothetical protein